jgi:Winged helix DNA-binding domain
VLAVQAQDLRSARLAIRARTSGSTAAALDDALTRRELVISWLNRGTLHLVGRDDYWWLHALTTPPLFRANASRLAQAGVTPGDAERGVAAIEGALEKEGPLTRDQLRERVRAVGVETAGQALVHLLMLTCLRGVAVRGPLVDGKHAYVLAVDWIGRPKAGVRPRPFRPGSDPLAELARRYLRGHAPADDRDLAKWAGLPLRDARAGLRAIASELVELGEGQLMLEQAAEPTRPRACLLDQWDPILVGWRSHEILLQHYPRRDVVEAHFHPFAYAGARAVATWSARQGNVALSDPFAPVSRIDAKALNDDVADVVRFLTRARGRPARAG